MFQLLFGWPSSVGRVSEIVGWGWRDFHGNPRLGEDGLFSKLGVQVVAEDKRQSCMSSSQIRGHSKKPPKISCAIAPQADRRSRTHPNKDVLGSTTTRVLPGMPEAAFRVSRLF